MRKFVHVSAGFFQYEFYLLSLLLVVFFISPKVFSQAHYLSSVQVNTTTDGHQDSPEIAVNNAGTVLVVFESQTSSGADENIFAVSYDRKTFREFYHTGPKTDTASLEAFPDGERFVVSWEQNAKIHYAIVSCKDGREKFIREPALVRSDIYALGKRPDVAISPDGSVFAIGWHNNDVVMQFFDRDGNALGNWISVADILAYDQKQISLKFWPDSTLVATWYSKTSGSFESKSKDEDIWFQLFDCKPVWQGGAPTKVFEMQKRANGDLSSTDPIWYDQEYPEVDVFDDGRFVIMWQDFPYNSGGDATDGSGKGAYFRIFNHDGTPQTDDIQISEHTNSFQKDADIRIRQSDKTIHFIYEDAYEAPPDKSWLAYPSYRPFDDQGNPLASSLELSDKSYGTDCRIAITDADAAVPNLVLAVWETKDIENYDGSGRAVIFHEISTETSVEQPSLTDGSVPEQFQLYQNYPNPFNSETTITYSLYKSSAVHLGLFNLNGQEILSLVNAEQEAGEHRVRLNAGNLPSGIYLARLSTGGESRSIKLINIK
ncbi:MAG: T9SS type A sorting domain-containing protein [Calditrichaeota bacterium]|nr:T9SS type A sorting domain-containing protein [Calditrichota bacterium]